MRKLRAFAVEEFPTPIMQTLSYKEGKLMQLQQNIYLPRPPTHEDATWSHQEILADLKSRSTQF
jgi:hypothetical protein